MNLRAVSLVTTLCAVTSPALAESQYCIAAVEPTIAARYQNDPTPALNDIAQKCRAGDTVILPINLQFFIAQLCDFNKSIVHSGDSVICVMSSLRQQRK